MSSLFTWFLVGMAALVVVSAMGAWVLGQLADIRKRESRMSSAEADSYRGALYLAELAHQELKRRHDATGEHSWLDVSTAGKPMAICEFCSATTRVSKQ